VDNAKLKNEKGAIPSMILKNRPDYSALSPATENIHYAELGIRDTSTPERQAQLGLSAKGQLPGRSPLCGQSICLPAIVPLASRI